MVRRLRKLLTSNSREEIMNKYQISNNILARANSTLYFLEHAFKFANMKANDVAWQRSVLIMLSYAFELILKAEIVITSTNEDSSGINQELKSFGHNIQEILCELDNRGALPPMKIASYQVSNNGSFRQYEINFDDQKQLVVEDFVDIRYDYINTALRNVTSHEIVIEYIDKMIELSKNVSSRLGLTI